MLEFSIMRRASRYRLYPNRTQERQFARLYGAGRLVYNELLADKIREYGRFEAGEAEKPVTREYLAANVLFYGFLAVDILFLWSYFSLLNPSYSPAGPDTASIPWMLIDATLPLLFGAVGVNLLRERP